MSWARMPLQEPTLVMVVCNEEKRLSKLLPHLRVFFANIVICVQASTDRTRELAERFGDTVIDDTRRGFGDASMPLVQRKVRTRWTFRVDADEWPDLQLIYSLPAAIASAEAEGHRGVWLPFRSWVQGVEWEVPHSHLRLWRNRVSWPAKLHSRPMIEDCLWWSTGHMLHRKSLDEHVLGYLDYLSASGDNQQWIDHNIAMIAAACEGSAGKYGWSFVRDHEWWPQVLEDVYEGRDPRELDSVAVPQP